MVEDLKPGAPPAPKPTLAFANIMICDDSPFGRRLVHKHLDFAGLTNRHILVAGNGQEALALLESNRIDLLITDLHMPVMDGLELIRALAGDPVMRLVPKIVCSSVATRGWAEEMRDAGVVGVLSKPFSAERFSMMIKAAMAYAGVRESGIRPAQTGAV